MHLLGAATTGLGLTSISATTGLGLTSISSTTGLGLTSLSATTGQVYIALPSCLAVNKLTMQLCMCCTARRLALHQKQHRVVRVRYELHYKGRFCDVKMVLVSS